MPAAAGTAGAAGFRLDRSQFVRSAGFSPYLSVGRKIRAEARTTNKDKHRNGRTPTAPAQLDRTHSNVAERVREQAREHHRSRPRRRRQRDRGGRGIGRGRVDGDVVEPAGGAAGGEGDE